MPLLFSSASFSRQPHPRKQVLLGKYKQCRNQVCNTTKKAYGEFVNQLFMNKHSRKSIWSLIKSKKKVSHQKESLPNLGPTIKYPAGIAESFNKLFHTTTETILPVTSPKLIVPLLELFMLSISQIAIEIKRLQANKASRPDDFTICMLKLSSPAICTCCSKSTCIIICSLLAASLPRA